MVGLFNLCLKRFWVKAIARETVARSNRQVGDFDLALDSSRHWQGRAS